jgi:hypothetical protein
MSRSSIDGVSMAHACDASDTLLFGEKVYNKEIGRGVGLGSRKRVQNSDDLFQSSRVPDKQELGIPRKG